MVGQKGNYLENSWVAPTVALKGAHLAALSDVPTVASKAVWMVVQKAVHSDVHSVNS